VVQLLVATTNPGKFAEVEAYLRPFSLGIVSLRNFENYPAVLEDGATFEENAQKKARAFAEASGLLTLADDSGLEVDALDGAPGIYSARYAGEAADDSKNNEKLLAAMRAVPQSLRSARFVCALALCDPRPGAMQISTIRESCEGRITFEPKGVNGFGYDPLFFYPPFGKTFGEIDRETKATVSHRGKALKRLTALLPVLVDLSLKP
jgi:XTP/dITP diphosphohydrolase